MTSSFIAELLQTKNSIDAWKVVVTSIVAIFLSLVLVLMKHAYQRRRSSKFVPGQKLPFIDILGHLVDMKFSLKSRNGWSANTYILQLLAGHAELFRQQKLFLFWIAYTPFVCLIKAEAAEALISGTKNNEKSWSYKMLQPWLGTGLLTSHGTKWKSRRKLLTPAFHFDILKDFLPVMNEQSKVLVKCLRKEICKEFTDIVPLITYCSLDIICETTLGVSVGAQENNESQYVKSVSRISEATMERVFNCLLWTDFVFNRTKIGKQFKYHLNVVHEFTRSVIQEKKKKLLEGTIESNKSKRKALLDLLLEHHIQTKTLTEEDIREEVDTFAFEGHDTTSVGMSWALYLIGLYKDVQLKVHEELDGIFGSDVERDIETDDISNMKYLDCVLKESQRLYPSVPILARNINADTEICGHHIKKGFTCVVLVYLLHRDENVFPQAEKFDPDRFLPENSINRHHYAYIPFSAGPRNCIGQRLALMEEKIVLANILRNYTVESLDQRDKALSAVDVVLRPAIPLRIKFRPRH